MYFITTAGAAPRSSRKKYISRYPRPILKANWTKRTGLTAWKRLLVVTRRMIIAGTKSNAKSINAIPRKGPTVTVIHPKNRKIRMNIPYCLKTCWKSVEMVSELIFGGFRSPLAVVFSDSKEYLSTISHAIPRTSRLKIPDPEKKTVTTDKTIINIRGLGESG